MAGIAAVAFLPYHVRHRSPKYKNGGCRCSFCYGTHQRMFFPEQDFSIVDYGAVKGGETVNTEAIAKAIAACNKAGGGRVVIPEGEWLTGPVHFKSNVNLHLEENAILRFTDNPS